MENQGDTRATRAKNLLKVFIEGSLKNKIKASSHSLYQQTASESDADIKLRLGDANQIIVQLETQTYLIPSRPQFLENFLGLLAFERESRTTTKPLASSKSHERAQRQLQSTLSKLASSLVRTNKTKSRTPQIFSTTQDETHFDELFDESSTIQSLLSAVLNLSGFQHFVATQLILHERGKPEAENYYLERKQDLATSQLSSLSFSQLFQTIRKSKSKNFSHQQLNFKGPSIIGPFLAKEFEFKDFSAILMISRNGFLPCSSEEIHYFNSTSLILKRALELFLTKTKLSDRERALVSILNNYPNPVIIRVGESLIFKNKAYQQDLFDKSSPAQNISLGYERTLSIWDMHIDQTISDINHHQRLSLLGELLNTLKHELSNPLFGLRLMCEVLADDKRAEGEEKNALLGDILGASHRCEEIIENFSSLYLESDRLRSINLEHLVAEVFTLAKSETRQIKKTISVEGLSGDEKTIMTHPTWLTQILFNLIINASQAIKSTRETGNIKVSISKRGEFFQLDISDDGPGIPKEFESQVLRPYFTTKESGNGLGLTICSRLSERLNAKLSFKNHETSPGVTFSLLLKSQV